VDVVMRQVHRAGEKMFVDFPGEQIPVYDRTSGEVALRAELFVAVAGASSYLLLPGAEDADVGGVRDADVVTRKGPAAGVAAGLWW